MSYLAGATAATTAVLFGDKEYVVDDWVVSGTDEDTE